MIFDFKLNGSKHFIIKNFYCQQSDKSGDKPYQIFLPILYKYLIKVAPAVGIALFIFIV